jgi:hypothetical protein
MKRCIAGSRIVRLSARVPLMACALGVALCAAALTSSPIEAATRSTTSRQVSKTLVLYSAVKNERYINNVDDLARGEGHNPFGNVSAAPPPTNEKIAGPLAGDEGLYAFDLFTDSAHTSAVGNAIFICWYSFVRNGLCDASFQLDGGSLIGKGAFNFSSEKSTFAIVGGTGKYRSTGGEIQVSALGAATQTQPVVRVVPMLQAQRLQLTSRSGQATHPRKIIEYSNPSEDAFVANADDELRGDVSNPFGTHISRTASGLANLDEKVGPFPGDEALFAMKVFAKQNLTEKTGSAVYTCQYYFDKNAFCDVTFQLPGGSLTAGGAFNFSAKTFELAITGGQGKYSGVTGDVDATASGKYSQQLAFELD